MPQNYGTAATIVSLFPLPIFERKPLIPSLYQVPGAREEMKPEVLIVQEGIFHVYLDEYRGMMTIRTPAITVAESVVRDFMDGQYMLSAESRPAIWTLPGEWTTEEIQADKDQKERLQTENTLQLEWFRRLILVADDEWSKFHQHRMLTEVQRVAARRLRLVREWALDPKPEDIIDCPGCGVVVNKRVAVCRECGCIINEDLYKNLKFTGEIRHVTK